MKLWQRLLSTWTPERAWFLGILYGDGNVYKNVATGDYRVSACGSLSTTRRWIALLNEDFEPQEFKRSPGTYQVYVNDNELVFWFEQEMGICGPKSGSLVWPQGLPSGFEKDFMRGLWDSDGYITIERRRHRVNKGNDCPRAGFASKSGLFVENIRDFLSSRLNLSPVKCHLSKSRSPHLRRKEPAMWWTIAYGNTSAMLVADWLYADPPAHLVNDDRMVKYREMCELREFLANQKCACGQPVDRQNLCRMCWEAQFGHITGEGTTCSSPGCGKPVLAHGICTACYNRVRRADPDFVRKSTGTCSCGGPSYRKGMCDRCYSAERRRANALTCS